MSVRAVGVSAVAAIALLAGFFAFFGAEPASAPVPDKFDDRLVADVPAPTALAFTPDGRLLVTSKPGKVWVVNGDGQTTEAFDFQDPNGDGNDNDGRLCFNEARGLLGIAVDPEFGTADHNYVYLFHNYRKFGNCSLNQSDSPVNRVSRFVMEGGRLVPASQDVLVDNIPNPNGQHDGGDVKFGNDGNLYISVGDGSCNYQQPSKCGPQNSAARDKNILLGKILRITPQGRIPAGNPFVGSGSDPCGVDGSVNENGRTRAGRSCQETFASGFRNPFRMAFDPNTPETTTKFYVNDVGQGAREEIDLAQPGRDYGWNCVEGTQLNPARNGKCDPLPKGLVKPVHEYSHGTGCKSVTGGAFVPDGAGWPVAYDQSYLFGDYVCGKIFKLEPKDGGGLRKTLFAGGLGLGGPIAMDFGPYETTGKALYYTTFAGGGQVRRIAYTAGNQAPVAVVETVGENYGPLTINFNGSKSNDPDGDTPLVYQWDFGDGKTETTTGATTSHTYATAGKYTATLTVRDSLGRMSDATSIEVFPGNTPPNPLIEDPAQGATFRVGQEFVARGSATDAEDDADGDAATAPGLRWEIIRHHDGNHSHPWSSGSGGQLAFTAPPPEGLFSTNPEGNYLEIRLTATDSLGLSKTVTRRLEPHTVDVRFATEPRNFRLKINGRAFKAPRTFTSWESWGLNVDAVRQEDRYGRLWVFKSWSDDGTKAHTIETPGDPTTYTATFRRIKR